jgi:hypothetical protein
MQQQTNSPNGLCLSITGWEATFLACSTATRRPLCWSWSELVDAEASGLPSCCLLLVVVSVTL